MFLPDIFYFGRDAHMATPVVTLERVVTDIASKADYLVATYFYSHDKQSDLTPDMVMSLPSRMAAMANDHGGLASQIESDITSVLDGYFDAARATVTSERVGESYKINVSVNVIEDGKEYELSTLLLTEGKLLKEIVRVTSDGKKIPF